MNIRNDILTSISTLGIWYARSGIKWVPSFIPFTELYGYGRRGRMQGRSRFTLTVDLIILLIFLFGANFVLPYDWCCCDDTWNSSCEKADIDRNSSYKMKSLVPKHVKRPN